MPTTAQQTQNRSLGQSWARRSTTSVPMDPPSLPTNAPTPGSAGPPAEPGAAGACTPPPTPWPRPPRPPGRRRVLVPDRRIPAALPTAASFARTGRTHQRAARGPGQAAAEYRPSCSRQQEATHRVRAQRPGRLAGSTSHCATASRAARTHPGHPSPAAQPNPATARQHPPARDPPAPDRDFHPVATAPVGEERQIIYSAAVDRQWAPHAGVISPHFLLPLGYEHYDMRLPGLCTVLVRPTDQPQPPCRRCLA
jgi:hypothetical protein